jgi:AcrR family transcriptional regulator
MPSISERVVAAAAEVFAGQGLGATVADVAGHAGVGVGTVYRRFANKDDLIYEVYADRVRAVEGMAEAASAAADPWLGFVSFWEGSLPPLVADRGLRELLTVGFSRPLGWARGTPPVRLGELLEHNHHVMGAHLIELVRRAKLAGALRDDFQASDVMVLALTVHTTVALGGTVRPDLYRRTLGFILDGLQPARTATTPLAARTLSDADLITMSRR